MTKAPNANRRHKPVIAEICTPVEVTNNEDTSAEELRLSYLSRQLGLTSIDHLTQAIRPERGPNQDTRERLESLMVGQREAINSLVTAIDRSALREPNKPYCSLLFLGPTGVGKTELGRALTSVLHDGDVKGHFTRIDCAEYQESHQLGSLIGAPPSYVGREQKPKLHPSEIEGSRHVLIFDEIEKANPALFKLMLQILEEGELAMQNSNDVTSFKECIVIITSNLGAEELLKALDTKGSGFSPQGGTQAAPSRERLQKIVNDAVKRTLPPEFIGRIDEQVLFDSLDDPQLGQVMQKYNDKLNKRLRPMGYQLHLTDDLVSALVASDPERRLYGGRRITKTFDNVITPRLSEHITSGSIPAGSDVYAVLSEASTTPAKGAKPSDLDFQFFFAPNEELLAEYEVTHPKPIVTSTALVTVPRPKTPIKNKTNKKNINLTKTDQPEVPDEGDPTDEDFDSDLPMVDPDMLFAASLYPKSRRYEDRRKPQSFRKSLGNFAAFAYVAAINRLLLPRDKA